MSSSITNVSIPGFVSSCCYNDRLRSHTKDELQQSVVVVRRRDGRNCIYRHSHRRQQYCQSQRQRASLTNVGNSLTTVLPLLAWLTLLTLTVITPATTVTATSNPKSTVTSFVSRRKPQLQLRDVSLSLGHPHHHHDQCLSVRGGATVQEEDDDESEDESESEDEDESEDEEEDESSSSPSLSVTSSSMLSSKGGIMDKVRNVIRHLLQATEAKTYDDDNDNESSSSIQSTQPTVVTKFLKSAFRTIEKLIGVKLLSSPLPSQSSLGAAKPKSKSKFKSKSKDDDASPDTTKTATASKSKSKPKPKAKPQAISAATKEHLTTKLKSTNSNHRIQRELKEFIKHPPDNLSVQVGTNIRIWIITMKGAKNTIYEGETFKLRVQFPDTYPAVPPSVYFLKGHMPKHEHVYTNGDICLSLLGNGWKPVMTAQSIAVSILSMLSSARLKCLPMDNADHANAKPGLYQKDWVYHDDSC